MVLLTTLGCRSTVTTDTEKKMNRPHCLYLWYIHGNPVCSEEKSNRGCPYAFWKCPVKDAKSREFGSLTSTQSSPELQKASLKT